MVEIVQQINHLIIADNHFDPSNNKQVVNISRVVERRSFNCITHFVYNNYVKNKRHRTLSCHVH
mgnify:CR=1 FL=1